VNLKRSAILTITFLILIILYFILENPFGSRKKEVPQQVVPGFNRPGAASIMIKSPETGEVNLSKEKGAWKVISQGKKYPADTVPVNKLLETVAEMKAETVASKNPKNYEAFEVTETKAIEIIIADSAGAPLAHFWVGKNGPDLFSTYVRVQKSNQVILTSGLLKDVFEKEINDWRDKTVFTMNKEDITEYRIEGDMILHLKKDKNNAWQVLAPQAFPARKEAAENIIGKFASLKAKGISEDNETKCQLDRPARTITAGLKNGQTKRLLVGREKNSFQHFIKAQAQETIFIIENYNLESFCPPHEMLKQEENKKKQESDNTTDEVSEN
jgi:hypothetical protein